MTANFTRVSPMEPSELEREKEKSVCLICCRKHKLLTGQVFRKRRIFYNYGLEMVFVWEGVKRGITISNRAPKAENRSRAKSRLLVMRQCRKSPTMHEETERKKTLTMRWQACRLALLWSHFTVHECSRMPSCTVWICNSLLHYNSLTLTDGCANNCEGPKRKGKKKEKRQTKKTFRKTLMLFNAGTETWISLEQADPSYQTLKDLETRELRSTHF